MLCKIYSKTSVISTSLGPLLAVLFMEVSLFRRFYVYTCQCEGYNIGQSNGPGVFWRFYVYTCQCEGYKIGQSNGVLLKEVAAFRGVL